MAMGGPGGFSSRPPDCVGRALGFSRHVEIYGDEQGTALPLASQQSTPASKPRRRRPHHREFPAGLFLGGLLPSRARFRFHRPGSSIRYSSANGRKSGMPTTSRWTSTNEISNPTRSECLTPRAPYEGGQREGARRLARSAGGSPAQVRRSESPGGECCVSRR